MAVTKTTRVVDDDSVDNIASPMTMAARVVWFIAGVIETLLGLRFILILLGANASNGFVNFIYNTSEPLARPFFGIFNYTLNYGVARVEISTLVAMAVYALIAYGITRLLLIGRASGTAD